MSSTELLLMTDDEKPALFSLEKRLRDQEQWAAHHDGKIEAKWEHQDNHNEKVDAELTLLRELIDGKFAAVFKKLNTLEVKVAVFSSLAAGVGSFAAKYLL